MALSLLTIKNQMPDPFRMAIVSLLWENSRIMPLLNFIPFSGFAYAYSTVNKLPGIGFRNLNAQFGDTQAVTNPAVESLAIMGGRIKTDSILMKTKPTARQNQIALQLEAAAKFWDKSFISGDPSVVQGSFLGLKGRIGGTQLLTPAAGANSPITMDDTIRLLDQVEGPNSEKILLMNQTTRRNLSHDVGKNAGGKRIFEDGGMTMEVGSQVGAMGSKWQLFSGARVQEVYYDEAEQPILPFTETGNTTSVYCFRPGNEIDERYVQGISGLPGHFDTVGPINFGEFLLDIVQSLFGIGVFSGYGVARLQGVNATPS